MAHTRRFVYDPFLSPGHVRAALFFFEENLELQSVANLAA
jgi:hypothetical protein